MKKRKRRPAVLLCNAAGTAVLVLLILACLPLTLPRLAGYRLYTVVSGSMEPEIPLGSLVMVHDAEPADIVEGDIIAFYGAVDSAAVITHRVVGNSPAMGEFITKGDANEERDVNPVDYNEFIGKVEHVVPGAGGIAEAMTGPAGRRAAGCLIVLAAVFLVLGSVLEHTGKKKKRKSGERQSEPQ